MTPAAETAAPDAGPCPTRMDTASRPSEEARPTGRTDIPKVLCSRLRRPSCPSISVPQAFNEEDLYVDLRAIIGHSLFLKCEGFNFAGSIRRRPPSRWWRPPSGTGVLKPDSILVESSSGNLGGGRA